MLVFVAVGGDEVGAIGGAIDGNFTLGAAADGADFFTLGGAEAGGFTLSADWTGHRHSLRPFRDQTEYAEPVQKQKMGPGQN